MEEKTNVKQLIIVAVLSVVAIGLGVGGGWLLRGNNKATVADTDSDADQTTAVTATVAEDASSIKKGDVFGSPNADDFVDSAQGYLQAGGMNGEGSHALLRTGGASQTVYLTSSVTDLDKFVGMDVRVWGETFSGQSVGWLMDVGRVEVINTQGTDPSKK
ncbi:hypothetical protein IJJ08_04760 [bacterium]|nr:hypothetical protein [bacterium]